MPLTAADRRVLAVLEQAPTPLAYWDIQRLVAHQNTFRRPAGSTVLQTLGWYQHGFCWAGRGLYGLYRHGLLPGLRGLGPAAGVFIHASDRHLTFDEVQFVLRDVGYRFSPGSLAPALGRAESDGLFRGGWQTGQDGQPVWVYTGSRNNIRQARAAAQAMRFARRGGAATTAIRRAAMQVDAARHNRSERLCD